MSENKKDDKIIDKAKSIIDQELKYKDICTALEIPVKNGLAKTKQIEWLKSFTDLEKLEGPTRFVIKNVHPDIYTILDKISNNECQAAFDAALYYRLLRNDGYALYISNMELLLLFNEVNNDFLHLAGKENKGTGEAQISEVVYNILSTWTQHRLENMVKRKIIRMLDGYKIYTEHENSDGQKYIKGHNVTISTDRSNKETLDGLCNFIFHDTMREVFPVVLWRTHDGRKMTINKIAPNKWPLFNKVMNKKIKEASDGLYVKMKRVNVIFPPDDKVLIRLLNQYFREIGAMNPGLINLEAKKKVLGSKKIEQFDKSEVEGFVERYM